MPLSHPPNPPQLKTLRILGVPIHVIGLSDLRLHLLDLIGQQRVTQIITAGSLLILEAQKSPALRKACEQADLVLPDSSGITWAAQRLGLDKPVRIPGIDLATELCGLAEIASVPVYLLGGAPGVAMRAANHLHKKFPYLLVAGMRDGYFKADDEMTILRDIARTRSRIVFVATGMPKQDLWIHENRYRLPPAIYIGVGGTFDVWSGDLKRAPQWLQKSGMEWLFRMGQQPSRFGRIAQLPKFAFKVVTHRAQ